MQKERFNILMGKQNNRKNVLRLLFYEGGMSRTAIAHKLNLTTAALSGISNELLDKGLIIESGTVPSKDVGRKRSLLKINQFYKYIISVNLHYIESTIAITDLFGKPLVLDNFKIPADFNDLETVDFICKKIDNALSKSGLSNQQILGCGVQIIGPVNDEKGIALQAMPIFSKEMPLKDLLSQRIPIPFVIENNICSLLYAENLFSNLYDDDITLVLKWGPGLGSATAFSGFILKDSEYNTSEIGHTYFRNCNSDDTPCRCGRKNCLETIIHQRNFINEIKAIASEDKQIGKAIDKFGEPNYNNLSSFIDLNNLNINKISKEIVDSLAIGINNAVTAIAPDRVVLFGDLFHSDLIQKLFFEKLAMLNSFFDENLYRTSILQDKSCFIGGVALAIEKLLL